MWRKIPDDEFEGGRMMYKRWSVFTAGMLIGAAGTKLLSFPGVRRAAKGFIKQGLAFRDWAQNAMVTTREDLEDLVEEAEAEYQQEANPPKAATAPGKSPPA